MILVETTPPCDDPSVSVDRLIRALLALGINRKQVGRAIGAPSCVRRHTRTAD